METFGERLKTLREQRNFKVADVAKAIGVSVSTYRDWEYGREVKGEAAYVELSRFFGVSISFLIMGKEESFHSQDLREIESLLQTCLERVRHKLSNQ